MIEVVKLFTDMVMLIFFILEFKILKQLLTSFIKETKRKEKQMTEEETMATLKRQNIFVIRDTVLIWLVA